LRRQIVLFRCWLRSCCDVTTTPEGRCRRRTALSVLFTCCPPGPLERNVSTSHWRSSSSFDSGRLITGCHHSSVSLFVCTLKRCDSIAVEWPMGHLLPSRKF